MPDSITPLSADILKGPLDADDVFKKSRELQINATDTKPEATPAKPSGADVHLEAAQEAMKRFNETSQPPKPTDPTELWGAFALPIAAFAGLATRHPLTTALNAMGNALQAQNEGNHERYQEQITQWKAAHDAAAKTVELELKAYENALKETDPRRRKAALEAEAIAYKNDVIRDLVRNGDEQKAQELIFGYKRAHGASEGATVALNEKIQTIQDERAALDEWKSQHPEATKVQENAARRAIHLGHDPDAGPTSATGAAERDIEAVANAEIAKREQEKGAALTEAEKAQIRIDTRTKGKTDAAAAVAATKPTKPGTPQNIALAQYLKENPDASAADIQKFIIGFKEDAPEKAKSAAARDEERRAHDVRMEEIASDRNLTQQQRFDRSQAERERHARVMEEQGEKRSAATKPPSTAAKTDAEFDVLAADAYRKQFAKDPEKNDPALLKIKNELKADQKLAGSPFMKNLNALEAATVREQIKKDPSIADSPDKLGALISKVTGRESMKESLTGAQIAQIDDHAQRVGNLLDDIHRMRDIVQNNVAVASKLGRPLRTGETLGNIIGLIPETERAEYDRLLARVRQEGPRLLSARVGGAEPRMAEAQAAALFPSQRWGDTSQNVLQSFDDVTQRMVSMLRLLNQEKQQSTGRELLIMGGSGGGGQGGKVIRYDAQGNPVQ